MFANKCLAVYSKYIHFVKVSIKNSYNHLKGSLEYFIPQIAIMLYTNLNKTLLGLLWAA